MRMSAKSKSRLSMLTAGACLIWLIQAVYQAVQQHQVMYWPNVVFYITMVLVVAGSLYSSLRDWSGDDKQREDTSGGK